MNGGGLVVGALVAHGVDTVFGIPGTHNLEIYRALHGSGIRHVTPRHEQGAGYAADGYARTSGRPGVAIVTTGPAVLNIAAAIGQAYSDSVPMLVIAPGMPLGHVAGTGLLHETKDQTAALAAIAGQAHRVTSHAEIPAVIARAFEAFASDRPRPVYIEIPLDLLTARAGDSIEDDVRGSRIADQRAGVAYAGSPQEPAALLGAAAEALLGAVRPLILAGGGAKTAAASIRELAEILGAPVLMTTNGKGVLPEDHPLAVTSALHLPAAGAAIDEADVVFAIGTDLAPTDFWYGTPAALGNRPSGTGGPGSPGLGSPGLGTGGSGGGQLIRVDIDPAQIVIGAVPDIAIVADAGAAVRGIRHRVTGARSAVPPDLEFAARTRTAVAAEARAEGARWLPWLDAIGSALHADGRRDAIVAADNAMGCYYGALGNLPVYRPGGFLFPAGFGTLGYAVPAAIGAKIANPSVPVIALSGDGGLMFSVQEIATAAALAMPLPIVVFVNGGYGEIRAEMDDAGIEREGVDLPVPDFPALAAALGGFGATPATPAELSAELTRALNRPGPTVLVVPEPSDPKVA